MCDSVDMSPLGSGMYLGSFTFTGTGSGVASVAVVLLDPKVRKHCFSEGLAAAICRQSYPIRLDIDASRSFYSPSSQQCLVLQFVGDK